MKYAVVYLLRGEAGKYNQKLVNSVGPKFGENYMVENPLPSHITLKSPFELNNSKGLERVLESFVKKQKASKIVIEGFGNFKRFVSFLKIKFSRRALKTQKELLEELAKLKGVEMHEFDINFKPHATIAYGNTKESFDKIWKYLAGLDKPYFELTFDNITILWKKDKVWEVYKSFEINKNI